MTAVISAPPRTRLAPVPTEETLPKLRPQLLATSGVAEILPLVTANLVDNPALKGSSKYTTPKVFTARAASFLLEHLATLPGQTWQDRWLLLEQRTLDAPRWYQRLPYEGGPGYANYFCAALAQLVRLDVVRPTYPWVVGRHLLFWPQLPGWRNQEAGIQFTEAIDASGTCLAHRKQIVRVLGWICARTGKPPHEVDGADLQELHVFLKTRASGDAYGTNTLWTVLRTLGWLDDPAPILPQRTRRLAPQTPAELVDRHHIPDPHRDVLVEYLKQRSVNLDHNSLVNLNRMVVTLFWSDVIRHHPQLTDFRLDRETAQAWRARLDIKPNGTPRQHIHNVLFAVRAFYLDLAEWAVTDSYWAPWVAPSPVSRADVSGQPRARKKVIARTQQRTRELVPLLPALVAQAEKELAAATTNMAAAKAAGHGGTVDIDGQTWRVAHTSNRIRLRSGTSERIISNEEHVAFWTWTLIETLRHSGLRIEEVLELTHLAIQPYTIKATGETIPLVHIPPSKNDEERMLVASPELVHVLSAITKRIRVDGQAIPLTQRWDGYERVLGPPMPHLFVHDWNKALHVMSMVTVHKYLNGLAARAGLQVNGRPVNFTPHDFRRIFATEALAAGLPPHIVQVLLGHKSLATTQGYAAIYPQDVIRHHRTFIATRRQTRPSEEYREPTPEEWAEFEAHFVQRKVSLGTCGRAYGTNCHHEHACLRCGLLRTDPAQIDRLRDIITNLRDRVDEAEHANWLGEVEGLKVSLLGAEAKLTQMERQLAPAPGQTFLGLPSFAGSQQP